MVMRWIKRFRASIANPLRPDFKSAPSIRFDLSGTILEFKCPPNEKMTSVLRTPSKVDIYKDSEFEVWSDKKGMSINLLRRGWNYWDKPFGEGAIGNLTIYIHLNRRSPQNRDIDSLFLSSDMKKWLLDHSKVVWGEANTDLWTHREDYAVPIDPEVHFWTYPTSDEDVKIININQLTWYQIVASLPQKPYEIEYHLPISDDHEIAIMFSPGALNRKFNDPSHNIPEIARESIDEFMSFVSVKLSPEYQKRFEEAKQLKQANPSE
ncbi:hypothetical protein HCH_02951 [Hahella chejuensis KCTC 2396]|uniref:Uncharacterized protein n=1 Tax=Hahella chejuensis (strain KCTC 2396) TaxID=349521 RepID=Q2SI01_HAHCH|nr:hypothetical protein [Hahella chejuensis]ABC29723.1 hypothetical protein HCH_02951 [Hahella chejuensis KCTC 2396]